METKLQRDIVDTFLSVPNLHDNKFRQALLMSADLDSELTNSIDLVGPPAIFAHQLVESLIDYGQLSDGREALEVFLESLKKYVGQQHYEELDILIQKIRNQSLRVLKNVDELSFESKQRIRGSLKIYTFRGGEITELIKFLSDLKNAYENLYAFDLKIQELRQESQMKISSLSFIPEIHEIILPRDRLLIDKVHIASPGFWEIFGNLNPLTQIREYLKERHERRKDKEWREEQERQKMILENINFETEILSKQIDLLKKANVLEEDVRRFVVKHYYDPLKQLNSYQDSGMIESAEIVSVEELPSKEFTSPEQDFPLSESVKQVKSKSP